MTKVQVRGRYENGNNDAGHHCGHDEAHAGVWGPSRLVVIVRIVRRPFDHRDREKGGRRWQPERFRLLRLFGLTTVERRV